MFTGFLVPLLVISGLATLTSEPDWFIMNKLPGKPRPSILPNSISPSNTSSCGIVVANLKLRFRRLQTPLKIQKGKTLSHLVILLLSISCDVERNPGPAYPCGSCGSEVKDSDAAVECDNCSMWFHIQCQGLNDSWYQDLINRDVSFAWTCTICSEPNLSNISSIFSVSSQNSFSSLADESQEPPASTKVTNWKQMPSKNMSKLKILCINCQSVVNKKHELHHLIESQNPDIVTATESWLTKEHYNSEIFPADLGYTVFRRDRVKGKGVGFLFWSRIVSHHVYNKT